MAGGAALIVAVATAILMWRARDDAAAPGSRSVASAVSDLEPDEAPTRGSVRARSSANADASPPRRGTQRDRARRNELRRELQRVFASVTDDDDAGLRTHADGLTSPTNRWLSDAGNLDPQYVQSRIREDYVPLAKDCYEAALKRDPRLRGRFEIVGDESVGGIVESAELTDGGTLTDPEMVGCLRESLLSLSFDPPPQGGSVTVVYPLDFSPD